MPYVLAGAAIIVLKHGSVILADGDTVLGGALRGALIGGGIGVVVGLIGWLFKKKK